MDCLAMINTRRMDSHGTHIHVRLFEHWCMCCLFGFLKLNSIGMVVTLIRYKLNLEVQILIPHLSNVPIVQIWSMGCCMFGSNVLGVYSTTCDFCLSINYKSVPQNSSTIVLLMDVNSLRILWSLWTTSVAMVVQGQLSVLGVIHANV